MSEDFLQFIWKFGLFNRTNMKTDTGETVQVISLGEQNADSGPDFLNARVRIGETTWAGNVEVHQQSADWYLHKHQEDKAYDNVILQVVYRHNRKVKRTNGENIPTVELSFEDSLYRNYLSLMHRKGQMPCSRNIHQIDPLLIDCWLDSLVVERLQARTNQVADLLESFKNSWDEAIYISLSRSFGFGLNADPFEMLARSTPLKYLMANRDKLFKVEAMLFGQSGLLPDHMEEDAYLTALCKEYAYLQHKYKLQPLEKHIWKFLRIRPGNFPTIRIAQLAALIAKSEGLFSQLLECTSIEQLRSILDVTASSYWDSHYTFSKKTPLRKKRLGKDAFNIILINVVVPYFFIYGKINGREDLKELALNWLNRLPAEKNRIVSRWSSAGITASSAFYSQALLQLHQHYCMRKNCLSCLIGTRIITSEA
jgi:hypothetical protein